MACVWFIGFCTGRVKYYWRYKKSILYCVDNGWQPIETIPTKERKDFQENKIFLTDGEKVDEVYFRLRYNEKGQIVFDYDDCIATHWRPYPLPPKIERK